MQIKNIKFNLNSIKLFRLSLFISIHSSSFIHIYNIFLMLNDNKKPFLIGFFSFLLDFFSENLIYFPVNMKKIVKCTMPMLTTSSLMYLEASRFIRTFSKFSLNLLCRSYAVGLSVSLVSKLI